MKKFLLYIKIFFSINNNKAKIILSNVDPLKKTSVGMTDLRVSKNLYLQLRKGKNLSYPAYLKYKALDIISNDISKDDLRNRLYELIFFLMHWIQMLDEADKNDK